MTSLDNAASEGNSGDLITAEAQGQLRSFVERLERLNEDKAAIAADYKEVMNELAGQGYDKKAVRAVIKYRAEDKAKRQELEAIVDLYLTSVGEQR